METISAIEDILRRLSTTSRQVPSGNFRDGKLTIHILLTGLNIDSTDTSNKLLSGAELWCHINFDGETKKIPLKSLFPFTTYPVIFDVFEFYGPLLIDMRVVQSLGPFSEEVAKFSLQLKDILADQEGNLCTSAKR